MNRLKIFLLPIGLLIAGCDNGFNCPIDPPECCYNSVFGCGTFDLPDGCSCSDYFGFRTTDSVIASHATTGRKLIINGTWAGSLNKRRSNCPGTSNRVSGSIFVVQNRSKIQVRVPGYGRLRGRVNKEGFSVKAKVSPLSPLCDASVLVNFMATGSRNGAAEANINYNCELLNFQCSMSYAGSLRK